MVNNRSESNIYLYRHARRHELPIRLNILSEFQDTLTKTNPRMLTDESYDDHFRGIGPSLSQADHDTLTLDFSDIYPRLSMPTRSPPEYKEAKSLFNVTPNADHHHHLYPPYH